MINIVLESALMRPYKQYHHHRNIKSLHYFSYIQCPGSGSSSGPDQTAPRPFCMYTCSSWPWRRRAHGSVTRTLDLRDLTRRRSDRESSGGQPVPVEPVCAGVMSRPLLLMPAPASEIDPASRPSLSSHPLLIPDLPNPRPTRPTLLIRHPLSVRERASKAAFQSVPRQPIPPDTPPPPPQSTEPVPSRHPCISNSHREFWSTATPDSHITAIVPAGSHGSPTPLANNPSRHHLFSPPKCRTITNRGPHHLLPNLGRPRTSALVANLHTGLSLYDTRLPSLYRLLPYKT